METVLEVVLVVLKCVGIVVAFMAAAIGCVNIALFLGRKK